MRPDKNVRRIGELAATAGVTVDTLRFYEREGLLPRATRTAGGFRLYTAENEERVRFIKLARELGLSLREIRELVAPENSRCETVRGVIAARLEGVSRRINELVAFQEMLQNALDRCDRNLDQSSGASPDCPVLHKLGSGSLSR